MSDTLLSAGTWAILVELATIDGFTKEHAARVMAKRPSCIVMLTERDAEGINYEVIARGGDIGPAAFEQGENEQGIWSRYVEFGSHASHRVGGHAFQQAARDQQAIADLLSECIR